MQNFGKIAKVINIDDTTGYGRIQVFLQPDDNMYKNVNGTINKDKIKWCFPAMPKVFGVTPKVGENVIVFETNNERFYLGPIYGQLDKLDDATSLTNTAFMSGSECAPDTNPELKPSVIAALPEKDDVAINGKKNCGIYIKDNDMILHSGLKITGQKNNVERNTAGDETFVQLSYDKNGTNLSTATIVSDHINLFGNKISEGNAEFPAELMHKTASTTISQEDLNLLLSNAKSVPYGENLVEVLLKIIVALLNHTHPIGNKPPIINNTDMQELTKYVSDVRKINRSTSEAIDDASKSTTFGNQTKYDADEENTTLKDEILSNCVKIN